MKSLRLVLVLAVALVATAALAVQLTTEVLVGTSATLMPQLSARTAIEIQNLGPNPIYCALGSSSLAVVGKSRRIDASGGTWALRLSEVVPVYCVSSAAQVTGSATVVTELR